MNNVTVKIEGLDELQRKLKALGDEFAAKALVGAAFSANKVLQDAAKENIVSAGAYDTGLLYKSIRRKKIVYDQSGTIVIMTGVDKNVKGEDADGRTRIPSRYAHLVHEHKPFMQDAYDKTKQAVVDAFVNHLKQKIAKHVKP